MSRLRRRALVSVAVAIAAVASLSACSNSSNSDIVLRSDPQLAGMVSSTQYTIDGSPDGAAETNVSITQGMNDQSPLVNKVTTTFGKGAGTSTETVSITGSDGVDHTILAMSRKKLNFGLSSAMSAAITAYDAHDHAGRRVCAAKVGIDMEPSIAGSFFLGESGTDSSWDIELFYNVPCSQTGADMPMERATFDAATINEMSQLRVSGTPTFTNKGRSVTIVGGPLAQLAGGWWEHNLSIISVSQQVGEVVRELSTSKQPWLGFDPGAKYGSTQVVYAAGDADTYTLKRFALNQQSGYAVNVRRKPTDPWTTLMIEPSYLSPWNDLVQSFKFFQGGDLPEISQLVDDKGLPKLSGGIPNDGLKKIETGGCQNCPNPLLSLVQFKTDANTTAYSMAIRGWYGANSSLVLFGRGLQGDPTKVLNSAQPDTKAACPTSVDNDGTVHSMSDRQCANWRQNAAFYQMVTGDPSKVGADVVGSFRVDNNGTFASVCSGSGEHTSCSLVAQANKLSASYQFSDNGNKLADAWAAKQLEGPVGTEMLGDRYASVPYGGNGLNFAMLQSVVGSVYQGNITESPWMVFALDTSALTIPGALGKSMSAIGR